MLKFTRAFVLRYDVLLLALAVASLFLWPQLRANMFATTFGSEMFMPHRVCYLQISSLIRLHLISDVLIGCSYVFISGTLAYLVYRARRDIPFHWIFLAFGMFIVACGMTHFMEVVTLWKPTFWLSGYIKLVTAIASVATAVVLPPLVPKTLELVQAAKISEERRRKLEQANEELDELRRREKAGMQKALEESEQGYRTLADSMPQIVWTANPDGWLDYYNQQWFDYTGMNLEQTEGWGWQPVLHPDDTETCLKRWSQAVETGENYEVEYRFKRHSDGEYRWHLGRATPARDGQGRIVKWYGTCTDIEEHKRTEQALQENQEQIRRINAELEQRVLERTAELAAANKELESFSYSVSHDLRSPLRSIDGFSQALLEDYNDKLDAQAQNYLHRVRAASQRMAQLIDDMLNLSRVSRGEMRREEIDLSRMARDITEQLQRAQPERIVEVKIEDGIEARGDGSLLRIALENLLGNAWKFTSKQPSSRIEFGAQAGDAGEDVFFVRDNGAGFDMAYADKLFGAFQRLHPADEFEGTGVGLATVQRIIRRHGGRIWAESQPGRGATFYFTL